MPDTISGNAQVNLDSTAFEKAIAEAVKNGFSKSLAPVEERFEKMFSKRNIKDTFVKNVFGGGDLKQADKRNKMMKQYRDIQSKINALNSKDNKTIKDRTSLIALSSKQMAIGMKNMVAGGNPYVMLFKTALEAAKQLQKQLERINKESMKFVGQGSILTDKETMSMMQRTGQTATESQGTQRALNSLGLSFDDLQSGRLTAQQAELFEELRQRELDKLNEVAKVSGKLFKDVQQITLGIELLTKDISDWITIAFAESKGLSSFLDGVKGFIGEIAIVFKNLIDLVTPILDIVTNAFSFVMDIARAIMPGINAVVKAIRPILDIANSLFGIFLSFKSINFALLEPAINIVIMALDILTPMLEIVAKLIAKIAGWIEKVIGIVIKGINLIWGGIADLVNSVLGMLSKLPVVGKAFKGVELDRELYSGTTLNVPNAGSNEYTNNYIYGDTGNNNSWKQNNNLFANEYSLVDN